MARRIEYNTVGKFNGLTQHSWTCSNCGRHTVKLGGSSAKRAGQKEANNHTCVDTSNDSWRDRKDLQ